MRKLLLLLFLAILPLFVFFTTIRADDIGDLQKQIDDLSHQLDESKKATTPLEGKVKDLEGQLSSISTKIKSIGQDLDKSERELQSQKLILSSTVRNFYIRSFVDIPLLTLFSADDARDTLKLIAFQQSTSRSDKDLIESITAKINKLADDRKRLASAQGQIDKQRQGLKGEIASAKSLQSELAGKIAALTVRQQEIVSAKSGGTFTTSVGDVPLADDSNASPAFNPGFSPAFAAFSFGAYSHRNGMSQYGAKARADSGQNYHDILNKYYPGKQVQSGSSEPGNISVDGYGSVDFQQYLYGIAEMPGSWNSEALKAQAVAARSYALSYTNNGTKSICATESCQVYIGHSKGGAWEQAVRDTKGVVLTDGGHAFSAQYASTSGGYLNTSGWDTNCGGRSCWTAGAWEKIAGSPWFYKSWYTQSYSNSSGKCGRSHPWLTGAEMADILNAWLVQGKDGVDGSRVTPTTTSCWGGNPYSVEELRGLADSKAGGAVTSVSGVSVSYSDNGSTANVSFETNRGSIGVAGGDFKTIFNLRAPGYISIRSPLFNVEKK